MNYYTSEIPLELAEKLKEKGMPILDITINDDILIPSRILILPTYASCFDWLMERGIHIRIESDWNTETQIVTKLACCFHIEKIGMRPIYIDCPTWYESANAAIEKALTLI